MLVGEYVQVESSMSAACLGSAKPNKYCNFEYSTWSRLSASREENHKKHLSINKKYGRIDAKTNAYSISCVRVFLLFQCCTTLELSLHGTFLFVDFYVQERSFRAAGES